MEAARNGYSFLKHIQAPDGHWPCEYDGPMFLTPGLVIGSYVTKMEIKKEERLELIRYLFRKAHKEDGGWGLYVYISFEERVNTYVPNRHFEGVSTVFGTGLNYTALRILGVPADHPVMVKARGTLHKLGRQYIYVSALHSY